ncbi:FtsX-like permease family protein, partial [Klebsiella pneumoniae]
MIRQLVTESLLLALIGGVVGLLFASWATQGLLKLAPQFSSVDLSPDIRVFVFTGATSLLAGLLFG